MCAAARHGYIQLLPRNLAHGNFLQAVKSVLVAALLLKLVSPKHNLLSRFAQQNKRMCCIRLKEINSFTYFIAQKLLLNGKFFFVRNHGLRLKFDQHFPVVEPHHCFIVPAKHCLLKTVLALVYGWWLSKRLFRGCIFSWAAAARLRLCFGRKAFVLATVLNFDTGVFSLHVLAEPTTVGKRPVETTLNFAIACVASQTFWGNLGCWHARGRTLLN